MKGQPLSDERKAKMAEGRRLAAERRATAEHSASDEALLNAPLAALEQERADARLDAAIAAKANPGLRARLLAGLDPDTAALITDAQLAEIEAEEQAKAKARRVKQALDDARNMLRQQAEVDHDLIPATRLLDDATKARMMEPVTFRVQLPHQGAGRELPSIRIDGFIYRQGEIYTRPRHVFDSLNAIHYQVHLHELRFSMLNQTDPANSARARLGEVIPRFEIVSNAA